MKRKNILFAVIIILIMNFACCKNESDNSSKKEEISVEKSNVAVVLCDTEVYLDRNLTIPLASLSENDLVYSVEEFTDGLNYVQLPVENALPVCGFVSSENIAFGKADSGDELGTNELYAKTSLYLTEEFYRVL